MTKKTPRCTVKIRPHGTCKGFMISDDPCSGDSKCDGNRCVVGNEKLTSPSQFFEYHEEAEDEANEEDLELFNLGSRLKNFMMALG